MVGSTTSSSMGFVGSAPVTVNFQASSAGAGGWSVYYYCLPSRTPTATPTSGIVPTLTTTGTSTSTTTPTSTTTLSPPTTTSLPPTSTTTSTGTLTQTTTT